MKNILISLLGTTLDKGFKENRWERWRPSVAICQHEDLLIDEYHLLYPKKFLRLVNKISSDIKIVSPETEVLPHQLDFKDAWDFEEVYTGLVDFLEHFDFHKEEDQYLFNITTGTHVAQICIYLLAESRRFPGKLIQTSPVRHDAAGSYSIIDLDLSKYDKIAARFARELKDDITFLKSGIETKNKKFNELIERIELVALRTKDPILLTGPTGAGKSNLARRIFELKKLKASVKGKFVEIECGTIRGDAAMSALFGHKKGAFTGAVSDRPGLLKTADKGMVFLDEIGELGLDEQVMLLRAIEEKKFFSVGADKESESDFQLICGTNRDLQQRVKEGLFREDLLARINLWTFKLPGLSDRPEDIEPNIDYELDKYADKTGDVIRFNKEARTEFLNFATSSDAKWDANFRDLNSAITRLCTLAFGGRITIDILNEEIKRLKSLWDSEKFNSAQLLREQYGHLIDFTKLDLFERLQLESVLRVCNKSKSLSDAGRKLFAVSRLSKKSYNDSDRLKKFLAKYDLTWELIQAKNS
jgi:transcriptional regulatory protein RtcR